MVKETLGATGAQLGRKLVVEGQDIVEFIAASEGREDMVGKVTSHGCSMIASVKSVRRTKLTTASGKTPSFNGRRNLGRYLLE